MLNAETSSPKQRALSPLAITRHALGLSATELAALIGTVEGSVQRWERKNTIPNSLNALELHELCRERGVRLSPEIAISIGRKLRIMEATLETIRTRKETPILDLKRRKGDNPVRKFRRKLQISQSEFAKLIGITKGAYCRIERGDSLPWPVIGLRIKRVAAMFEKKYPKALQCWFENCPKRRKSRFPMTKEVSAVAQYIRDVRSAYGWVQNQLAVHLKCAVRNIYCYEYDIIKPSAERWAAVCKLGQEMGLEPPPFVPNKGGLPKGYTVRRRAGYEEMGAFIAEIEQRSGDSCETFAQRINTTPAILARSKKGYAISKASWRVLLAIGAGYGVEPPPHSMLPAPLRNIA